MPDRMSTIIARPDPLAPPRGSRQPFIAFFGSVVGVALPVQGPAVRDGLPAQGCQPYLSAGHHAGGHVQDERFEGPPRNGEGDWICAEEGFRGAERRDGRIAVGGHDGKIALPRCGGCDAAQGADIVRVAKRGHADPVFTGFPDGRVQGPLGGHRAEPVAAVQDRGRRVVR